MADFPSSFYTYKEYNGDSTLHLWDQLYATQAAADAAAALDTDILANQGTREIPGYIEQGMIYDGGSGDWRWPEESDQPAADQIKARRDRIVGFLLEQENLPQLAIWGARDSARAKSYNRWVEANCRAASVDTNMDNDTRYGKLLGEVKIPGALWYHLHSVDTWYSNDQGWYRESLGDDEWAHYITTSSTTTPDSREGTPSALHMPDTVFSWVNWLASQRSALTLS